MNDDDPGMKEHSKIIGTWADESSDDANYFERFESPDLLSVFWGEGSRFRAAMQRYLQPDDVLEIASGAGRHSAQIVNKVKRLTLIDTSDLATRLARERFSEYPHVVVDHSTDGLSLPYDDRTFSFIFSFDAMVHFEPLTVAAYVAEIARTLRPGGIMMIHHSAYSRHPERSFRENPDWRNFMPKGWMEHLLSRNGLSLVSCERFRWIGKSIFAPCTDALTIAEKP